MTMQGVPIASIKARSAEIQVHQTTGEGSHRGAKLVVQGWSAPAILTGEEARSLSAALTDAASRATLPASARGVEGPWTASIDLRDGRRATVGFLGELQEGDRPEVFLSVSPSTPAPLTKEIAWLSPESASLLSEAILRAAGETP